MAEAEVAEEVVVVASEVGEEEEVGVVSEVEGVVVGAGEEVSRNFDASCCGYDLQILRQLVKESL